MTNKEVFEQLEKYYKFWMPEHKIDYNFGKFNGDGTATFRSAPRIHHGDYGSFEFTIKLHQLDEHGDNVRIDEMEVEGHFKYTQEPLVRMLTFKMSSSAVMTFLEDFVKISWRNKP